MTAERAPGDLARLEPPHRQPLAARRWLRAHARQDAEPPGRMRP
jgi:hypothetical protein